VKVRPEWSQRLLRKGVLVKETYEVFAAWDDSLTESQNLKATLSGRYPTAGWEREVESTLLRRLRHIELIRPLVALAKGGMSVADWRDCLRLWIGATEQPFHDFGTIWLFVEHEKGRYQVRTDDVHAFFDKVALARGPKAKAFSDYGKLRGARDLLRMAGSPASGVLAPAWFRRETPDDRQDFAHVAGVRTASEADAEATRVFKFAISRSCVSCREVPQS
jgi:hypothetical protein